MATEFEVEGTQDMSDEANVDAAVGSPLLMMTQTTPTALWNDSANPTELATAIAWGAVGATCNPVIALAAIRAAWLKKVVARDSIEIDPEHHLTERTAAPPTPS
jgi:hypothetical protein